MSVRRLVSMQSVCGVGGWVRGLRSRFNPVTGKLPCQVNQQDGGTFNNLKNKPRATQVESPAVHEAINPKPCPLPLIIFGQVPAFMKDSGVEGVQIWRLGRSQVPQSRKLARFEDTAGSERSCPPPPPQNVGGISPHTWPDQ